ncbi:MAG TPA: DsrE family protein [Nitrospirota bacterium]|nr:DsrE family protein [Nitrospirota bacterium]
MENKEFVFIITHSYDKIEKAAGALQLAANMAAFDAKIDFFLMNEGAFLAKKGFAESMTWQKAFSPAADLIKSLVDDFDCRFYICASCVKPYGLEGAEWIKNAEVKPGSYLGELLMKRQGLTF